MSVKPSAHSDPKATQRLRLADAHGAASLAEANVDPKATQHLRLADARGAASLSEMNVDPKATRRLPHAFVGPDAQVWPQISVPDEPTLVAVLKPALDPKATQRIRLPKARRSSSPGADVTPDRGSRLSSLRQWAARHKRALILVGALVVVATLALSFAAIQRASGVQQAAGGSRGLQMRAASLAQEDLSEQDLKWADLSLADLRQANLSGADMLGADLSGADLGEANLETASLRGADLSGAKLRRAVLRNADLHWAVLRNADLSGADLREADLQGVDLENATLEGADLEGANLRNAYTLGTILPDGAPWSPRSNLRRFTDPTYPDFWRPEEAQSLARRQVLAF